MSLSTTACLAACNGCAQYCSATWIRAPDLETCWYRLTSPSRSVAGGVSARIGTVCSASSIQTWGIASAETLATINDGRVFCIRSAIDAKQGTPQSDSTSFARASLRATTPQIFICGSAAATRKKKSVRQPAPTTANSKPSMLVPLNKATAPERLMPTRYRYAVDKPIRSVAKRPETNWRSSHPIPWQ